MSCACDRRVSRSGAGACGSTLTPAAAPLREALDPMPSLLDPLGVADMRVIWWKSVVLPANWKMAQEAFMEGYHVPQTHPQLTLGHPEQYDPDSLVYSVHGNGHSSFQLRPNAQAKKGRQVGVGEIDAIIESTHLLSSGLEAMTLDRDVHVIEGMRRPPHSRGEHLRRRVGEGHLPVRRRRRHPDAPAGPGRPGPLGRRLLRVPQLLRAPPIRQRPGLPGPSQRGRPRIVPVRAVVALHPRRGRRHPPARPAGAPTRRTTPSTGRASPCRTSPTSGASNAASTAPASTASASRTPTRGASPTCTASSTATSGPNAVADTSADRPSLPTSADVIVVGSGAAALTAAIAAHDNGARVTVVERSLVDRRDHRRLGWWHLDAPEPPHGHAAASTTRARRPSPTCSG